MASGTTGCGALDWHSAMKACARARSRLATATRLAFPASRMACQFLRAMKAAPRMPQRQVGVVMSQDGVDREGRTFGRIIPSLWLHPAIPGSEILHEDKIAVAWPPGVKFRIE